MRPQKIANGRTDGRTDRRTDIRRHNIIRPFGRIKRKRVNQTGRGDIGGRVIKHPLITNDDGSLYCDATHLTDIGNDIFICSWSEAIEKCSDLSIPDAAMPLYFE